MNKTNGVSAGGTQDPYEAQSLEKLRKKKHKNYAKNKQKAKQKQHKETNRQANNITSSGMDDL